MPPYALVLGVAQDGGHPHPGCRRRCCRGVAPGGGHLQACLALVDPERGQRWLVDATPSLPEQLDRLDEAAPSAGSPGLDGILLTHAHMGHYTGLQWLGREALGARGVRVHVMPRLAAYLTRNGPWSQLVEVGNVVLDVGGRVRLNDRLAATAIPVPHRDEYSETVAWRIAGPRGTALWLPDIDAWEPWAERLEDVLATVDVAWLDGTFWDDGELERDMAEVPHPRMRATLDRIAGLPAKERAKVRFIHLNHTNPALDPTSPEAAEVARAGCAVAREGERVDL